MFSVRCSLVLASASPRRSEYLSRLGLEYRIVPAAIDETSRSGEQPLDFARRMAAAKARQVADALPDTCVIGADTVVAVDSRIFGKPRDHEEAYTMLMSLQGRTHEVITGFALISPALNIDEVDSATTKVTFGSFSDATIRAYIASGEPMDKAGAYGIQGIGSFLVQSIAGSCSNVVGLPVHAVVHALLKHNLLKIGSS